MRLQVFADAPEQLEAKPEHIEQHRALVAQAIKLYGSQHYDHYDFLLSLSDQLSSNGLEHQRSSENGQPTDYFTAWNPEVGCDDLLGHEYTHWSGAKDRLAREFGKKFGDKKDPLLVSVRSGARASMPGMMDTVLNLGLNDQTVEGLARLSGDRRFAFDSYRRFIQMYGDVVEGVPHHAYEDALSALKAERGVENDTDLSAEDLDRILDPAELADPGIKGGASGG